MFNSIGLEHSERQMTWHPRAVPLVLILFAAAAFSMAPLLYYYWLSAPEQWVAAPEYAGKTTDYVNAIGTGGNATVSRLDGVRVRISGLVLYSDASTLDLAAPQGWEIQCQFIRPITPRDNIPRRNDHATVAGTFEYKNTPGSPQQIILRNCQLGFTGESLPRP